METGYSFDINQYERLDKVGNGSFGTVYRVKDKSSGEIYACKVSHQPFDQEESSKETIRNLVREVNILSQMNHPLIVKFIGFSLSDFRGNPNPSLITEYIPKGSLSHYIDLERQSISDIDWNDTKKLTNIYGIASAMSYLHSHNIIHRDLKPDNILMDDNLNPKIADFGLSKINHQDQDSASISLASTAGIKGTFMYIPPEIFEDLQYTKAGDVYAFAMIVYEIITNQVPFKVRTIQALIKELILGHRPDINLVQYESYKSLIQRCWSQDPSQRPSFDQILNDLRTDPGFITDLVDESEYLDFIDYIDSSQVSFDSSKRVLTYPEFMKKKKKKEKRVKVVEKDNSDFHQDKYELNKAKFIQMLLRTPSQKSQDSDEVDTDIQTVIKAPKMFLRRPVKLGRYPTVVSNILAKVTKYQQNSSIHKRVDKSKEKPKLSFGEKLKLAQQLDAGDNSDPQKLLSIRKKLELSQQVDAEDNSDPQPYLSFREKLRLAQQRVAGDAKT